jgi:hypothetical protein
MRKMLLVVWVAVIGGCIYLLKLLYDSVGLTGILTGLFCITVIFAVVALYNFAKGQSIW